MFLKLSNTFLEKTQNALWSLLNILEHRQMKQNAFVVFYRRKYSTEAELRLMERNGKNEVMS